ncbi:response regulator transcription factor [Rhizobium leguminosarum]|jgi:FixJ family two-component response regulator|uniref:response regulator transcription factor n=1 Tax=Rhizobium TaxID=379 RepID=UPI000362EDED|nr:response regulator [Rhizobium leguminosarum]MBY2942954.1 response regulator transcription factor [Rhizobium leguminosarum]MBY2963375.1 response regulator transcription factor [Rhizobium leguminosarum]MBY2995935.1 response regulator transcription factor [Rhizobium leguminosarum]MBY3033251.1 response regulator transcription factor [Rhizobium leguminosarum]MBY3043860.1 response regulator transcription factor [Rhizobium leguminosarum]
MKPVVHIVDDDKSYRTATARLLSANGLRVEAYESGDQFLSRLPDCEPGCVLLDLQMPGQSGLQIQRRLCELAPLFPVVFLTGEGDIKASVEAMKAGAKDFLEKSSTAATLMGAIDRALVQYERQRAEHDRLQGQRALVAGLSPREAEVFRFLIRGRLNKQIAHALGISERTVKVHRHQVMEKLGVRSLAEAVSIAANIGLIEEDTASSLG